MCEICHRDPCPAQCPNYEPEIIGYCERCGEPIYVGDDYYDIDGDEFCEECIIDAKRTAER